MPRLFDASDVRLRLEQDRVWSAFSLADLDAPYAQHAVWFGPAGSTSVVLVYGAFTPPIVFCQGDARVCGAVLAEPDVVARTSAAYLNVTAALLPVAAAHFTRFEQRRMVRMVLPPLVQVGGDVSDPAAVRLTRDDLPAIRTLYSEEPPAFFLSSQVDDGVYFGVREGDALTAIAGTHVVSRAGRVGAIGNVYTRSDRRNRGLASLVTAAVARQLRRMNIETIVLNIVSTNDAARRVYERLGFVEYCEFFEGLAER